MSWLFSRAQAAEYLGANSLVDKFQVDSYVMAIRLGQLGLV